MASSLDQPPGALQGLNLSWLQKFLVSSIGRKFVMGITGLLLCSFLVGHLAGNLLLFKGAKDFNEYAEWIHHQKLLPLIELGLAALFLAHIYLAIVTTIENRRARQQPYFRKESKQAAGVLPIAANTWMFISGAVVLGFVLLHLVDLRFELRPDLEYAALATPHARTVAALSNPVSRVVYLVGIVFLGFHLSHGFASAFQSLGLSHPKYTPTIKAISILFAVAIAVGFASLPIFVPGMQAGGTQARNTPDVTAPAHP